MSTVRHHLHELHKRHARLHHKLAEAHEEHAQHHEGHHDCADCAEHHRHLASLHKAEAEHHEERAEELASPDFGEVDAHTRESTKAAGGNFSAINRNPGMDSNRVLVRAGQPTPTTAGLEPEFQEMLKVEG